MTEFDVEIGFLGILLEHHNQLVHQHRQQLVERVHAPALHPLGNRESSVLEAQVREDVVDADRLDAVARPRDETHGRLQHPGLTAKAAVVLLEHGCRVADVLRGRFARGFAFLAYKK